MRILRLITIFTLISLFLNTCVTQLTIPPLTADAAIQPILNTFLDEAHVRGYEFEEADVDIIFGVTALPTDNDQKITVGLCYYDRQKPLIVLNKMMFASYSAPMREVLLFHELGHCLLNRDHIEDTADFNHFTNIPVSIMFPMILDEAVYTCNRSYYLDELFDPRYIDAATNFLHYHNNACKFLNSCN